eukprot:TRINITY_DN2570_c0_g1_i1.p1 TRINITY_DN2570_c0_g1~~TRINITY_DN2570_c0_g1_i1.p1  ORF type:complete len:392 (+),score=57.58 TRINITY_DN2570_c0_g1_i1:90-1265(+)
METLPEVEETATVLSKVAELDATNVVSPDSKLVVDDPNKDADGGPDDEGDDGLKDGESDVEQIDPSRCCMCQNKPKYKCPGCHRRTCCLACVKQHKVDFDCDGKRPRSRFVSSKSQLTEQTMWQDYCLLEDAGRQRGAISRPVSNSLVTATGGTSQGRYRNQGRLRSVAASHQIRLEFLPDVFERHRRNTSRAHDNLARIYWHVEVVFRAAGIRHHQEHVPSARPLSQILDEYFEPKESNAILRHHVPFRLSDYVKAGKEKLVVMIQRLDRPANDPGYISVPLATTLRDALRNLRVVEYPTLYVATPAEASAYPQAERPEAMPALSSMAKHATRGRGRGRSRGRGRGRARGRGRGRGNSRGRRRDAGDRQHGQRPAKKAPPKPTGLARHFA